MRSKYSMNRRFGLTLVEHQVENAGTVALFVSGVMCIRRAFVVHSSANTAEREPTP
jgi:hypothetical protein